MSKIALLETIKKPEYIKELSPEQLELLAAELRTEIIAQVAKTGGHLASNLGVVELTIALLSTHTPGEDVIIWDVGHQCYAYKLLTGRCDRFDTLRQLGGISGFPRREESAYDAFGTGHSSTSISAALGFAKARDLKGTNERVVAIIGDGALTGGMAWEALNNAANLKTNLTVVLNDNQMSIAKNVGALSAHLSQLRMQPLYRKVENKAKEVVENLPIGGKAIYKTAEGIMHGVTRLVGSETGVIFEELGFTYLGPIDGHDTALLTDVFNNMKILEGPVLVHIITKKGKGYEYAENNARAFHGVSSFHIEDGNIAKSSGGTTYTKAFSDALIELATEDERIVAITAAMPDGTGLTKFSERFPDRFYDVGIAEQHAVTFAAGLAAGGFKPVFAVYSTFLQRAYDQIVHDVCVQNLPVLFCIDRAGLVGDDGPTHHGAFDLSYLRHIPNMIIAAPSDEVELKEMLRLGISCNAPFAIRYPRGACPETPLHTESNIPAPGVGEVLAEGRDICIIAVGSAVALSLPAVRILGEQGISAALINARFVKPLPAELITSYAQRCKKVLVVEENAVMGGFGSAVIELLAESGIQATIKQIGLPDRFLEHGAGALLRESCLLDPKDIAASAAELYGTSGSFGSKTTETAKLIMEGDASVAEPEAPLPKPKKDDVFSC
ncbi:MAG: 1-deoxy-D-xylulose-5-phosphate synthase [Armatimonadota bacterium]